MSISQLPKWNYTSYYGTFDENIKPKQGLAYFMIKEHIERIMKQEKEKVIAEMHKAIESFKNVAEIQLKSKLREVEKLKESIINLRSYVHALVKENTLSDPNSVKINTKLKTLKVK